MDTAQTNRVTMFKTVSTYLVQNNSVWSGMTSLVTAIQQFNDLIAAINVAAQKQDAPTAGATLDKEAARDALEDVLFLTCEALTVLGHTENDNSLVALAALSPSTLGSMDVEELSNRATNVLAQATARARVLAAMNVTQANIDELKDALQAFNDSKEQPRTATAGRMVHTESLTALLRDASSLLRNQIDRLVNLFRRTNPDFVAGYRGARVIVDRAASHKPTKTADSTPPAKP